MIMKDGIGHVLTVGQTVLTKGYASTDLDFLGKIVKIDNDKSYPVVHIESKETENSVIIRSSLDVVVVDQQIIHNQKLFPENFI